MADDSTKLTIQIETILRGLEKTLRGLSQVEKQLKAVASITLAPKSTASFDKAAQSTQRLQNQQKRLAVQVQELANREERARLTTERLVAARERLAQSSAKAATAEARSARSQTSNAQQAAREVANINAQTARQAQQQQRIRERAARTLSAVQVREAQRGADAFVRSLKDQDKALAAVSAKGLASVARLTNGLNALGGALLRIGGGLRSLGATAAILITGPLAALGALAARSAADIDVIRNRLIATEGSVEAANQRLDQLRRLADESIGVTRRAAQETFATLSVIGDITEDTITRQIKALGRLNAAFTIEDQQQFFRNLVQIFSQGFERADIKEALGRIPIFNQLLAAAFGTSDPAKLRELKAAGKLTLDTFLAGLATAVETDATLNKVGESLRTRFSKTFERLTDALEPLGRAILGPLERIITVLEPIILRVAAAFDRLPPRIQTITVAIGLLAVASGPLLFILGGLASGIGGLATALAVIAPLISTIGLPAIAVILAGIAIVVGEVTAAVTILFAAWQSNFLGIQDIVRSAASAILTAFGQIRDTISHSVQRVLPTLQSITTKVLTAVTALWETFGRDIVGIVGPAFRVATDVVNTFLKEFGNFVDLLLKLIDADFDGAWKAFARILLTALDFFTRFTFQLNQIFNKAAALLLKAVLTLAVRLAQAGRSLAERFIGSMAAQIAGSGFVIRDALLTMLAIAVAALNPTSLANLLVSKFITALRNAARESVGAVLGTSAFAGAQGGAGPPKRGRPAASIPAAGGRGGRGAGKDLTPADITDSALDFRVASAQFAFNQEKDLIERLGQIYQTALDDRKIAIEDFFRATQQLRERELRAEIVLQNALQRIEQDRLLAEKKQIARDRETTPQQKKALDEIAENKFFTAIAPIAERTQQLLRDLAELPSQTEAAEKAAIKSLEEEITEFLARVDEANGRTAAAAAAAIDKEFLPLLERVIAEQGENSPLVQLIKSFVEFKKVLPRIEQLETQRQQIEQQFDIARLEVETKVADHILTQRQGREQINELLRKYLADQLVVLGNELALAASDQQRLDIVQRIAETQNQIANITSEFDRVAQEINEDFFSTLEDGFANVFRSARDGVAGVKEALLDLGFSLLDVLNQLAAQSLAEQFFGGLEGSVESIGGFLTKTFGLATKGTEAAALTTAGATAGAALTTGGVSAGTAMTTGGVTAATTLAASVTTAAAAFAASVIAAGAAFAAAVGAAAGVSGAADLASGFAGFAAGDVIPAAPRGKIIRVAEGGYDEAVLTTDPRHAVRQLRILRQYLRQTKGLFGRIPEFAAGDMISARDAEMQMLSSIQRAPLSLAGVPEVVTAGGSGGGLRLRQILVTDQRDVRDWMTSAEGEQVQVDFLTRNRPLIKRLAGGRN